MQVNVIVANRDFFLLKRPLFQGNHYRRTRFITRSACETRLVTHGTRLTTLSTRSNRFSTRRTRLSTRSICLSIRSTRRGTTSGQGTTGMTGTKVFHCLID